MSVDRGDPVVGDLMRQHAAFIGIINPTKAIPREQAAQISAAVTTSASNTLQRLHKILVSAGGSLHAAYNKALEYPNSLLFQDKRGNLQFAQPGSKGKVRFINMEPQTIKASGGQEVLGCKPVTYCEFDRESLAPATKGLLYLRDRFNWLFINGYNLRGNLPAEAEKLTIISFTPRGRIDTLTSEYNQGRNCYWFDRYIMTDKGFHVQDVYWSTRALNSQSEENVPYGVVGGAYRRLKERQMYDRGQLVGSGAPSIEEEITGVLNRLPLDKVPVIES